MTLIIRAHINLARWAAFEAQVQVLLATITNPTAPGLRASLSLVRPTSVTSGLKKPQLSSKNTPTLLHIERVP